MSLSDKIIINYVTCMGLGKLKYAPGTFGSLVAFPFLWLVTLLAAYFGIEISEHNILNLDTTSVKFILYALFSITIILFIISTFAVNIYIKKFSTQEDPREVVIDEFVGQILTCILCIFGIVFVHGTKLNTYLPSIITDIAFFIFLPFILFRIFDILKPWPINWIDRNIKGGIGVMLDDIVAALLASLMYYAIIFLIINLTA